MQIVLATTPKQESLLPNDLLTSTTYINSIIDVLEENINSTEVEPDPVCDTISLVLFYSIVSRVTTILIIITEPG